MKSCRLSGSAAMSGAGLALAMPISLGEADLPVQGLDPADREHCHGRYPSPMGQQPMPGVRLAEMVASLSLATDLGLGQPQEHVLRQTVIATRLAAAAALSEREQPRPRSTSRSSPGSAASLTRTSCRAGSTTTREVRAASFEVDRAGLPMMRFLSGTSRRADAAPARLDDGPLRDRWHPRGDGFDVGPLRDHEPDRRSPRAGGRGPAGPAAGDRAMGRQGRPGGPGRRSHRARHARGPDRQ